MAFGQGARRVEHRPNRSERRIEVSLLGLENDLDGKQAFDQLLDQLAVEPPLLAGLVEQRTVQNLQRQAGELTDGIEFAGGDLGHVRDFRERLAELLAERGASVAIVDRSGTV